MSETGSIGPAAITAAVAGHFLGSWCGRFWLRAGIEGRAVEPHLDLVISHPVL
ncbi:hypothetical protein [Arthrobacter cheniae]|uniref:hypothetical protein n=1 Tax=Arthrobacter cheniae TaxID=1258888 RepID=UPI0015FEEB97|nr:hypothetical protein [Arthrobacter cheniae]